MKIINIYGQYDNHTEARIIGNREGLEELKRIIENALKFGEYSTKSIDTQHNDFLMASDGEGYEVIVEKHDDKWGIDDKTGKPDPKSFWNKPESDPQYVFKERQNAKLEFQQANCKHIWVKYDLHPDRIICKKCFIDKSEVIKG